MQEEEYRAAVQRYRDMVWRVALNACRQTQDAEDVVQDVFLKLYTTRREFAGEEHLKHWLLRVTVNRCRTLLAGPWRTRRADAVPMRPTRRRRSMPGSALCMKRCARCRPASAWRCISIILKATARPRSRSFCTCARRPSPPGCTAPAHACARCWKKRRNKTEKRKGAI